MKILIINDYITEVGGAETYINNIAKDLASRGHFVKVLTSENLTNNIFIDWKNKYIPHSEAIKFYLEQIFNLKAYLHLKKILSENKPDVIHLNNIYKRISPSVLLALNKYPVVMTLHGYEHFRPHTFSNSAYININNKYSNNFIRLLANIYNFINKELFFILFKNVDLFIAPSKYIKEIAKTNNLNPITQLYNGIGIFDYSPIINRYNILYVGRLEKEKGISVLLQSIPEIIKQVWQAHLYIVGDGSDKENLVKLIKELQIEKYVTFKGKVDYKNIQKFYIDSTLVVIPSTESENLPTVCIEAMSIGRPIIGSSVGGLPELIDDGKNGFLVQPSDAKALSVVIIQLLSNPNQCDEFSLQARKKALNQFGISEHTNVIELIYKQTIQNHRNK